MEDGDPGALGEDVIHHGGKDIDTDPATIQGIEMGVPDVQDIIILAKTVRQHL